MESNVVFDAHNIVKTYPGVVALDNVSFDLRAGEVHALIGENGAGKSTLIKVLSGAIQPDSGEILLSGEPVSFNHPRDSLEKGIAVIYQELALATDLTAAQNIMLGRELHSMGVLRREKMAEQAQELVNKIDPSIDVRQPVYRLSIGHQQVVEIAKTLALEARVVIMDEPTAALNESEVEHLLSVTRSLANSGVAVVYVTHRLDELFEVADRVTVLKDGKLVATREVADVKSADLVEMMTGLRLEEYFPPREDTRRDEPLLKVEALYASNILKNISFSVHPGEIVGVAGLVGSGQSELARAIAGADPIESGTIELKGKVLRFSSPREAIREGVGLLPADRKQEGLMLRRAVKENISVTNLKRISRLGWLSFRDEKKMIDPLVDRLSIRTPSLGQEAGRLSGGNQQKVVLARWLASKPDLLIFDEPTRGIDVGAKVEIYQLMRELASQGVGILMMSSELPELLGMSDRLLVMVRGKIVKELPGAGVEEQHVLHLMMEE